MRTGKSGWYTAGRSRSAGSMGATADSSRHSATSLGTSGKNRDRPPKRAAPTAAPNSRGRRPETATCCTTSARKRAPTRNIGCGRHGTGNLSSSKTSTTFVHQNHPIETIRRQIQHLRAPFDASFYTRSFLFTLFLLTHVQIAWKLRSPHGWRFLVSPGVVFTWVWLGFCN